MEIDQEFGDEIRKTCEEAIVLGDAKVCKCMSEDLVDECIGLPDQRPASIASCEDKSGTGSLETGFTDVDPFDPHLVIKPKITVEGERDEFYTQNQVGEEQRTVVQKSGLQETLRTAGTLARSLGAITAKFKALEGTMREVTSAVHNLRTFVRDEPPNPPGKSTP